MFSSMTLSSRRLAVFGLALLATLVLAALLAPVLSHQDPQQTSTAFFQPPTPAHPLGTNDLGQDVFARLLYGARASLAVAIAVAIISTAFSVFMGSSAALVGGHYEQLVLRLVDALLVIPPMLLALLLAVFLIPGNVLLVILLSVVTWPGGARIVRAQTAMLKEKPFVGAARCFGAGLPHLTLRHIVPGLFPVLVANFVQVAKTALLMGAALAFVGITDPAALNWGREMYQALSYIYLNSWLWWLLPIGFALSITILSFTLLGYALEEVVDPRLRRTAHAGD